MIADEDVDVGKVNDFSIAIINAAAGMLTDDPTHGSYRALRLSLIFAAIYATHIMKDIRMDSETLYRLVDVIEEFLDGAISTGDN